MNQTPDWPALQYDYHIRAMEQLLRVQENSVLEQTRLLYEEVSKHKDTAEKLKFLHNQLALILRSAGEGIYGIDTAGRTNFWNAAAERMTGYSREEVLGRKAHAVFHHSHPDGTPYDVEDCKIYHTLARNIPGECDHEVFWKKDGTAFPVEYTSRPLVDKGEVVGAVVTFQDITQRLEQEQHLREAEEQAQRARKLAGIAELAEGICHEILNPLNIISLQLQVLHSERESDSELRTALNEIKNEIERINKTVRSIDRFTERHPEAPEAVDLNSFLDQALEFLRDDLSALNIQIEESRAPNLPPVPIHLDRLNEIFHNLLLNAKEAMPGGGTLRICTTGNANTGITLTLEDNGEGIAPEHLERVFDPFFTTREETYGRGLGLTVCHHLIEEAGGNLKLTSTRGQGTVVHIHLPAASATGSPSQTP